MSDYRELPLSSRNDSATPEPGVRAARVRAGLTQEQVAERTNVSIHTLRRWDQDRNRPSRPEQMQLLAAVLGTRIDVIWPATDDPLVAEALRLEHQRGASVWREPSRQPPERTSPPDVDEPAQVRVRRLETSPVGSFGEVEPARASGAASEDAPSVEERAPANDLGGLPPWPDEFDDEPPSEPRYDDSGAVTVPPEQPVPSDERLRHAPTPERVGVDHDGVVTLRARRPAFGRPVRRAVFALAAALMIGGVGTVVAGALGDRPAGADPSAQTAPIETAERARVEARARDVATMRAAADRGDHDAAIAQARQLDDAAAVSGYRESAARVLVRRADKAARRGDLSLARSRLRAATRRYGIAPGATAVQARVRRIERQRKERAQRQRAAARRAAAAAAQQRAAADAARASESSVSNTPAPATSSVPQSSAPAPSTSSPSKGSGGGSGAKRDPEEAVDPGLF